MDKDVLAVGDQANQGVWRDEVQRLLQGIFELEQLLLWDGRVDHEQEDGPLVCLDCLREDVLDSCILLHQLGRQGLLCDVARVVRWELVLGTTAWASPSLVAEVDAAEGVQHSVAGFAPDRLVLDERQASNLLEGCVHTADGHL